MQWFKIPSKIYFEKDSIEYIHQIRNMHKAIIVTDRSMVDLGFVDKITDQFKLRREPVQYQLFCDVEPDQHLSAKTQQPLKGDSENHLFAHSQRIYCQRVLRSRSPKSD